MDTIVWRNVRFSSARSPTVVPFKFPGVVIAVPRCEFDTDYARIQSRREIDSPAKGSNIQ